MNPEFQSVNWGRMGRCNECGRTLDSEPSWYNIFLHKRCFDERMKKVLDEHPELKPSEENS